VHICLVKMNDLKFYRDELRWCIGANEAARIAKRKPSLKTIIVLDSLRADAFQWLILPSLKGVWYPQALSPWKETLPCFSFLSSLFNELERTAVVTGGGYASFPDWKVDYYDDDGFYPLLSRRALDLPLHEFDFLLIHDYFIHDYFKDTNINPQKMRPEDSAEMRRAYAARVRAIVPSLKEHIEKLPGEILITADHGEEFFEYENFYHHGSFSGSSLVYRVPLFFPSGTDVLRPEPVVTKSEIRRFLGFGKS